MTDKKDLISFEIGSFFFSGKGKSFSGKKQEKAKVLAIIDTDLKSCII